MGPTPGGARADLLDPAARRVLLVLQLLLASTLLLQRFAIPAGGSYVSPVLLVTLAALLVLHLLGAVVEDRGRTSAYLLAAGALAGVSLLNALRGAPVSLTSVGLLLVAYVPFCFVVAPGLRSLHRHVLRSYSTAMVVVAVAAVLQFAVQSLGIWSYRDVVGELVPDRFLAGGYVISYPVAWGSPIYKSNAFVLLEPSFCSQFLALGILVQLVLGERLLRRLPLFGVALVTTVSGTGLILLAVGLLALGIRRGRRFLLPAAAAGAVGLVLVAATPLGEPYRARLERLSVESSSGYQRFVAPYPRTWDSIGGSAADLLLGRGAGYAQEQVDRIFLVTAAPAIEAPHTKLLIEYGLVGGAVMLVFLLHVLFARSPSLPLSVALATFYFVLSASLLQTQTIYFVWILLALFPRPPQREAAAVGRPGAASADRVAPPTG